ncbi:precorrin-6A synthase (deacetylating) [Dichotomicrobium thermohalophilum]|uniref:Precorrin-6A synthase [deacetylating] n=1 Tax=Dichotomicrobium thermohalophilum TaxID=933063 RepID=A0A397PE51_9HYPH|nr:precorrin-6A synthase (deacetylating) [Dichotomicrobium thermohalophilum]RIA45447.1 precorrin-6A synthase (deacetylating) [Dichotomicrobium thermohalophilum]
MELRLIGIGTGNPDHITLEGVRAVQTADLVLIPRKGAEKRDLADLRREICARLLGDDARIVEFDLPTRNDSGDYMAGVADWHDAVAAAWQAALAAQTPPAASAALLIWGDPSLYDSSLRIAARLDPQPDIRIVPGITALQALTAAHRIPLNEIGAPVLITTGRRLREEGWPDGATTVAVMLDGGCAFQAIDPEGVTIWWGAYLGMERQILRAGPLAKVGAEIVAAREQARAAHGWIMDTYLLRWA